MALPKRLLVLLFFFSFAVACDRSITEPTRGEPTSSSSTLSTPTPAPTSEPTIAASGVTFTGPPAPGCQPAAESLKWVVTVNSAPELVRLYSHAFRDPVAGCANTVHSLATLTVVGPLHYATGESGQTQFLYEANSLECGRLELGIIHKDANGHDTMLTWRVVNSGVDCAPPPPPPLSDPPPASDPPPPPSDPPPSDPPPSDPPPAPPPPAPDPRTPLADPCAGPWQYAGPNPFELPNSGAQAVLAYVHAHVSPLLVGPIRSDAPGTTWTSDGDYAVVLVKSSTQFWLHVNVTRGSVLPTSSTTSNGNPQGISHVDGFVCRTN